ncbi:DoxX-like family protein [Pustulibacterium marinum]|uniref:DoxX-like family protein n=1 Tax=Pustulibacterium marinum TaxID=1224947 RepID=A0A1I7GZY2_9FLAO|nr:DoxX family protein [Pustulibacterium marinum]SFU54024.1 DoxX-like family protein [Pustulibacterium marinum]
MTNRIPQMERKLWQLLKWMPSLLVSIFYINNGFGKVLYPDASRKILSSIGIMRATGIFLIVATLLFLYQKTIIWGATLLALYMTFIVGVHIYKGKPYEVAMLIVFATVVAAYMRKSPIKTR